MPPPPGRTAGAIVATVAWHASLVFGLHTAMSPARALLHEVPGRAMVWLLPSPETVATRPLMRQPVREKARAGASPLTPAHASLPVTRDSTASPIAITAPATTEAEPAPGVLDLSMVPAVTKAAAAELAPASTPSTKGGYAREDRWRTFAKRVGEAGTPDCLHPDALRNQPPIVIGDYVIGFGGLAALPALAVAKFKGQCR